MGVSHRLDSMGRLSQVSTRNMCVGGFKNGLFVVISRRPISSILKHTMTHSGTQNQQAVA